MYFLLNIKSYVIFITVVTTIAVVLNPQDLLIEVGSHSNGRPRWVLTVLFFLSGLVQSLREQRHQTAAHPVISSPGLLGDFAVSNPPLIPFFLHSLFPTSPSSSVISIL